MTRGAALAALLLLCPPPSLLAASAASPPPAASLPRAPGLPAPPTLPAPTTLPAPPAGTPTLSAPRGLPLQAEGDARIVEVEPLRLTIAEIRALVGPREGRDRGRILVGLRAAATAQKKVADDERLLEMLPRLVAIAEAHPRATVGVAGEAALRGDGGVQ